MFTNRFVGKITFIKLRSSVRDFFYTVDDSGLLIDQIIGDHDIVTALEKQHACMRADEARSACYKNFHLDFIPSVS